MTRQTFRPIDEKHLASEAEILLWSPKMDLIAIANVQGEVALHRLSWKKVWVLAPPGEGALVRSMAWRPDGKVLAIGYSTGRLQLCSTENKEILDTNQISGPVDILQWVSELSPASSDYNSSPVYQDDSAEFLSKLPSLSKTYSAGAGSRDVDDKSDDTATRICDQALLNLLVVATAEASRLYLYAFGVIPCLKYPLDLMPTVPPGDSGESASHRLRRIHSATVSDDLGMLSLVLEWDGGDNATTSRLILLTFHLPLLASRRKELHFLALKYGHLSSLLGYLQATIRSITESWEDILLEIDTKLSSYAHEKHRLGTGTVSDDFLELLMFGTPTDELHKFLLHDLTEKGLKKLGHSIELSYSNIQKLVLKHLHNVGQALLYHLADLRGMAVWRERFGVLGLRPERADACLEVAGEFMLKAAEIQQVIDNSMKNFKAFFRWLYVVILRLSDEPVPAEINRITQQDLQFVAEFLKDNFTGNISETDEPPLATISGSDDPPAAPPPSGTDAVRPSFNLELVGQYLKNEELQLPPDLSSNPWMVFLQAHPALNAEPALFRYPTRASLVQANNALQREVNESLRDIARHMGRTLSPPETVLLADIPSGSVIRARQHFVSAADCLYTLFSVSDATAASSDHFVVVRQRCDPTRPDTFRANRVHFDAIGLTTEGDGRCTSHSVLDYQFYNGERVSVLLSENTTNGLLLLAQVPLSNLLGPEEGAALVSTDGHTISMLGRSGGLTRVNGGSGLACGQYHRLEGVRGERIAVSGTRNLACVLFASRRRVRLFEMDVEDDDEEGEELSSMQQPGDETNSSREESALLGQSLVGGGEEDKENVKGATAGSETVS